MENLNEKETHPIPQFSENELFKVPQGFFDTFPEKALAAVKAEEAHRLTTRRRIYYLVSSAAAVALVVLAVAFFYQSANSDAPILANGNSNLKTTGHSKTLLANNVQLSNGSDGQPDAKILTESNMHSTTTNSAANASAAQSTSIISDETDFSEEELSYMDYQVLEFFSDELEENDYYELR